MRNDKENLNKWVIQVRKDDGSYLDQSIFIDSERLNQVVSDTEAVTNIGNLHENQDQ